MAQNDRVAWLCGNRGGRLHGGEKMTFLSFAEKSACCLLLAPLLSTCGTQREELFVIAAFATPPFFRRPPLAPLVGNDPSALVAVWERSFSSACAFNSNLHASGGGQWVDDEDVDFLWSSEDDGDDDLEGTHDAGGVAGSPLLEEGDGNEDLYEDIILSLTGVGNGMTGEVSSTRAKGTLSRKTAAGDRELFGSTSGANDNVYPAAETSNFPWSTKSNSGDVETHVNGDLSENETSKPFRVSDFYKHSQSKAKRSNRWKGKFGYNETLLSLLDRNTTLYPHAAQELYCSIRLDLLEDYHSVNDHIDVPIWHRVNVTDYDPSGFVTGTYEVNLGLFVSLLRKWHSRNEVERHVPSKYVDRLNELGMRWEHGRGHRPHLWNQRYKELQEFFDEYGHCNVPSIYGNRQLALWVRTQRVQYGFYRRGTGGYMTQGRIAKLKELNFNFACHDDGGGRRRQGTHVIPQQIRDKFDEEWSDKLSQLQSHSVSNGGLIDIAYLLLSENESTFELGLWVWEQLRRYHSLRGEYQDQLWEDGSLSDAKGAVAWWGIDVDLYGTLGYASSTVLTGKRLRKLHDAGLFSFTAMSSGNAALGALMDMHENLMSVLRHLLPPEVDLSKVNFNWDVMLKTLQSYRDSHGHCDVPPIHGIKDKFIYDDEWVKKQMLYGFVRRVRWEYWRMPPIQMRQRLVDGHGTDQMVDDMIPMLCSDGDSSTKRLQKLDDLGFRWDDNTCIKGGKSIKTRHGPLTAEYHWWEQYHELTRYKKRYGNLHVPSAKGFEGLHWWVSEQRVAYKKLLTDNDNVEEDGGDIGGKNTGRSAVCLPVRMTESHHAALLDLGFDFLDRKGAAIGVEMVYDAACHNVGPAVPPWLGRRPAAIKLEEVFNNDDYYGGRLESIPGRRNFEETAWVRRYEAMQDYIALHGTSHVAKCEDAKLAHWAYNQRLAYQRYKSNLPTTMTVRKIELLKGIAFDFGTMVWNKQEDWDLMFKMLVQYKEVYGHCCVPVVGTKGGQGETGKTLGLWVAQQRSLFAQGKLLPELVDQLNDIGFDLNSSGVSYYGHLAFESLWNERLTELARFKEKFGHCDVRPAYNSSDYYDLGVWVRQVRDFGRAKRKGRKDSELKSFLTKERTKELDTLGFVW